MIVATAALGQTVGILAAIQRLRPLRPPPQTYSSQTHSHEARWVKCLAANPPNIGQPALPPEPLSPQYASCMTDICLLYRSQTGKDISQIHCCIDGSVQLRFTTVSTNLVWLQMDFYGRGGHTGKCSPFVDVFVATEK